MSKTDQYPHRADIARTLARLAGTAPDARAVADAVLGTWQRIAFQLEPVIGARGVDALFGRSVHLTGREFPWLAVPGVQGNSAASLASIKACLESREASSVEAAGQALLGTFTGLLVHLIGDSLAERLLGHVWAPATAQIETKRELQP